jgi:thioredoxin 1
MEIIELNSQNFAKEVEQASQPVLVDFWAPWCGPCKMLSPLVDQIAQEHDEFKVCKVNVDEEGDLAARFGVSSIPTLLVFKNGECVNQSVGFIPKDRVLALVQG